MGALPRKTMASLQVYDDWGRAQLKEAVNVGYKDLRRLLEHEHGVTAANDTMARWHKLLSTPSKREVYATAWAEEEANTFGSRYARLRPMTSDGLECLDNQHYYQTHASWSYCAGCGRRRFGAMGSPPLSGRYAAPATSNCVRYLGSSWSRRRPRR